MSPMSSIAWGRGLGAPASRVNLACEVRQCPDVELAPAFLLCSHRFMRRLTETPRPPQCHLQRPLCHAENSSIQSATCLMPPSGIIPSSSPARAATISASLTPTPSGITSTAGGCPIGSLMSARSAAARPAGRGGRRWTLFVSRRPMRPCRCRAKRFGRRSYDGGVDGGAK